MKYTLIRSSWRSESPQYVPVGSIPCSSQITCQSTIFFGKDGQLNPFLEFRDNEETWCPRVSERTYLPELRADLVAALTTLNVDDLAERWESNERQYLDAGNRDPNLEHQREELVEVSEAHASSKVNKCATRDYVDVALSIRTA